MDVKFELSLENYNNNVESFLLEREASNNLMLGILDRLTNDSDSYKKGFHLGLVEEDGELIYAFMQTSTNNWILADIDYVHNNVIRKVAAFLWESRVSVPGVLGPTEETEIFRNEWERLTHTHATINMRQLIYQIDQVNIIPETKGQLHQAKPQDRPLVKNWLIQFGVAASENISEEDADQMAQSFICNRTLYFWMVDGKPVSMVNRSRKTKNGATLNAVFTPDEWKRNGYATAAVAKLTEKLLEDGFQFCSLYTDLANSTSNNIYKKIGYYEVGSSVVYTFNNRHHS
ncbi:GNAT family N-acetyltransferase [Virgibacillus litoralis]|uniref:GNAT family acetyltransferase n=1 Tax=Virgibacillus litoralis TaxID=578221 RepID=A0ABS4HDD0_9BACI|nr:GNAT family N-acetyltransferase [Virgibacillus litoralis]MBP1948925.1 putative GNAT family acetyltransferase [Virgibacillus litoralis]